MKLANYLMKWDNFLYLSYKMKDKFCERGIQILYFTICN